MNESDFAKLPVTHLKRLAKARGIKGVYKMRKVRLAEVLANGLPAVEPPFRIDPSKKSYDRCEHLKVERFCKECGGTGLCMHGKRRCACKGCGGSVICEHGKVKYVCKECGGCAICEHGGYKQTCKECGGSGICCHDRRKYSCKFCKETNVRELNDVARLCEVVGWWSMGRQQLLSVLDYVLIQGFLETRWREFLSEGGDVSESWRRVMRDMSIYVRLPIRDLRVLARCCGVEEVQ